MTQELMPALGDAEPTGMTVEELHAQIGLQIADGLGNGRLRDRQRLRGLRDRAVLGHGDKGTKLTQRVGHDSPMGPQGALLRKGPA
ncbi:hypothetical protein ruthe_01357 [Rubellimicrobium thermophilum DSM 16684]|uniref:Uncharacterized protein n=1 Tax=Rubellimicrobium thermophilum DSM 16684 TaxID=1123069 RepID=S9QYW5_9RHOB|nr:hypothetical protein ruthe_01357 [Rubellimicrobium thermophilum DSM 16684]